MSVASTALLSTAVAAPPAERAAVLKAFRAEFIAVRPGIGSFPKRFVMGSATHGPAHSVAFDYEFAVAKYEVPQNLWQAVMGSNPSKWKGPRNSVEMVTFDEAVEFCQKVTKLLRATALIAKDQVVRLPSEAEWEFVARAGTTTTYSFGDDVRLLDEFAWSTRNAAGNDPPVGAKKANPWGLFDIHGYLWEWCVDVGHKDYTGAPKDGSAWLAGGDERKRIIRGGSWKDNAEKLASAYRVAVRKDLRDDAVGLRCVLATQTEKLKRDSE